MAVKPGGAMGQSCPIVLAWTDGTAGRIAAFLSLGLLSLLVWQGWGRAVLALAVDFALRALGYPGYSPVARSARILRRWLGWSERRVHVGPKRFAASIGGLFSLGVGLALLTGFQHLGVGLGATLGVCAGLEAFFGFCLACQIHPWLSWLQVRSVR